MAVTIKGKSGGVLEIMIQPSVSYDEIKRALWDKISRHKGFFAGCDTKVIISGRKLQHAQKEELKKVFRMDYDISNVTFGDDPPPHIEEARVGKAQPAANDRQIKLVSNLFFAAKSIFVAHTLRGGQRVECEGDVTVLGDVNDGAEVIAGGSIAVMGTLRGLAHAGATGRSDVVVAANCLVPKQLRISGKIAVFPDDQDAQIPKIAEYKNGSIVIRPLKPLGRT